MAVYIYLSYLYRFSFDVFDLNKFLFILPYLQEKEEILISLQFNSLPIW